LNTAGRENVSSELRSALDRRRLFSFGAHIAPCYGLAVSTQRLPSRIFLLGLLLWLAVLGLACGSSSAPRLALIADQPVVETAGAARVMLKGVDGDILMFDVMNLSGEQMVILRDQVRLQTPRGTLYREPGGLSSIYNVPPYGAHEVYVKFDLSGVQPGERLLVQFEGAIMIKGQPVAIPPVVLTA